MSGIKLGDKVRFVNENMQGTVTSLKGNTAGVTVEDDFEIPVLLSEIVKIQHEEVTDSSNASKAPAVKSQQVKVYAGVHIAFERITDTQLDLKLHNSEADTLMFAFYEKKGDVFEMKQKGELELEKFTSLGKYNLDEFGNWPQFGFMLMYADEQASQFKPSLNRQIRFHAKEFHGSFGHCYFLGKQAYTFRLDQDIKPANLQKLAQRDFTTTEQEPKIAMDLGKKPSPVTDLHIEKLTSSWQEMNASDIIALQMEVVTKTLEMAHVHKMKNIIFIHGVGNHFLKNKIRNYLSLQKQLVQSYKDADMLKYGGGATEVVLV